MAESVTLPPPLTIRELSPVVGVKVRGLDLSQPVDSDTTVALQELYWFCCKK